MKRAASNLFVLAATGFAILVPFAVFIVVFEVPNRVGLTSVTLDGLTSTLVSFVGENKIAIIWGGLLLCLVMGVTMKLLAEARRAQSHRSSRVPTVHSPVRQGNLPAQSRLTETRARNTGVVGDDSYVVDGSLNRR